jgi:hypothetical protein
MRFGAVGNIANKYDSTKQIVNFKLFLTVVFENMNKPTCMEHKK